MEHGDGVADFYFFDDEGRLFHEYVKTRDDGMYAYVYDTGLTVCAKAARSEICLGLGTAFHQPGPCPSGALFGEGVVPGAGKACGAPLRVVYVGVGKSAKTSRRRDPPHFAASPRRCAGSSPTGMSRAEKENTEKGEKDT